MTISKSKWRFMNLLEMIHTFIMSRKGGVHLVHNNFVYRSNLRRQGRELNKIYWECIYNRSTKCRGRLKSIGDNLYVTNGIYTFDCTLSIVLRLIHTHWFRISFLFFFRFILNANLNKSSKKTKSNKNYQSSGTQSWGRYCSGGGGATSRLFNV